jgi:hypothetical protein
MRRSLCANGWLVDVCRWDNGDPLREGRSSSIDVNGKARTVGPTFSGCWSLLDSAELFSAVPAHAASTTPPRSQRHRHRRAEELMWYSNSNFPQRQRPPQHVHATVGGRITRTAAGEVTMSVARRRGVGSAMGWCLLAPCRAHSRGIDRDTR